VGGNVGRLNAVSTVGSFLGTAAIGYILIPLLPNSMTMYATAALLTVVCGVYFLGWGRKAGVVVAAAMAALVLAGGYASLRGEAARIPSQEELFRGNSNFGLLQVLQSKSRPYRYFLNDYLIQNTYDTEQGRSLSMFTYLLEGLARAYAPRLDRVLCIGMGIGVVPRQLARRGATVDVVEINPAVVDVAEKYFDLDPKAFQLFIGDGRYFLNHTIVRYDAVILDAFLGESSPSHLMSREAFTAMRRILRPGGVLVINCFADFHPRHDFFGGSLDKTLKSVFPGVRIHGTGRGNVFFVASDQAELVVRREPDFESVHPLAREQVREAFAGRLTANPDHGLVLTDDFNPVEFHDAANREAIRRDLAEGMKLF
jgi:spermidine synthase